MKKRIKLLCTPLLIMTTLSYSQNLPSLMTERNINSTFSILAYDENASEWGIAVATDNIYVGNSTIYIQPELGAFSVIAETEPRYAIEGFEKLEEGKSISEAITEVKRNDKDANYRQVAGMDAEGTIFTFTGKSLKYWNGNASHISGEKYVVMGNQLAKGVLNEMSETFKNAKGTLAERLLKSLVAGQNAGGQLSGKQSAALMVKGTDNEWYNQIDLRVDNSKNPIEELQTLMNYHYGRIRLNQATFALRANNLDRANQKLKEAESLLEGWTGIYSKIAAVHILLDKQDEAVQWIKKGLSENLNWSVNIPAFYFLHEHPEMRSIIRPDSFSIKDWESALVMLSTLGREMELIDLASNLLAKEIESSYLHYLLGRAYHYEKKQDLAMKHLGKALKMDAANIEAEQLLTKIRS